MHLLGARLAFVDESGLGAKLNETFVKTVTGGSSINARPLYGKVITFKPTFHLFLLTNNKPEINVDESTKRRVVLIPFLAEFRGPIEYDKENPRHKLKNDNIEATLLTKLDQLLTWIVRGSIKYFNEGLGDVPQKVANATKEYMNENDEIGNFLDDVCDKIKTGYVYHSALFDKFKEHTNSNISSKIFTQMMKAKGYPQSRRKNGTIFSGLVFKANNDNEQNTFVERESDIHKTAKERLKEWLDDGIPEFVVDYSALEYPIIYTNGFNSISINKWSISTPPSFNKCKKDKHAPIAIVDVMGFVNSVPTYGFEVCYTNPVSTAKQNKLNKLIKKVNSKLKILEIDAEWINKQIKKPTKLEVKIVIG